MTAPTKTKDWPFLLRQALVAALGPMAGVRRAVMFTGGFDSMLLALLAQQGGAQVVAVTVQFEDFNALTVAGAAQAARQIGLEHRILQVEAAAFLAAFEEIDKITNGPMTDLDVGAVWAAFKKYDTRTAGDTFISGMGCDQWFGNEALELASTGLEGRFKQAERESDLHQQVAQAHGCCFIFPFLSKEMLALAGEIPAALKKDKKLLRSLEDARSIQNRTFKSEVQVPPVMRRMLARAYGPRAKKFLFDDA